MGRVVDPAGQGVREETETQLLKQMLTVGPCISLPGLPGENVGRRAMAVSFLKSWKLKSKVRVSPEVSLAGLWLASCSRVLTLTSCPCVCTPAVSSPPCKDASPTESGSCLTLVTSRRVLSPTQSHSKTLRASVHLQEEAGPQCRR